jgi:helicase SWR1
LGKFEDTEDTHAAAVVARKEVMMEGANEADFGGDPNGDGVGILLADGDSAAVMTGNNGENAEPEDKGEVQEEDAEEVEEEEGGMMVEYMITFVSRNYDFFRDWWL